jgi:hypothetical protein
MTRLFLAALLLALSPLLACRDVEVLTTQASAAAALSFEDCLAAERPSAVATCGGAAQLVETLRSKCGPATCDGPCVRCIEDADCGPARLCLDGACGACPVLDDCPAAEAGLVRLQRNGCELCEAAPSSECNSDADCATGRCYRGAACTEGCDRPDCCANACAPVGCVEPAPLGCMAACPPSARSPLCRTSRCTCSDGRWRCDAVETRTHRACTYPP